MWTIPGYRLSEQLYESSNSLVYRAVREIDDQPVVLKMLKDADPGPERIAWFKREYEVTHSLNLGGVVKAYALETMRIRDRTRKCDRLTMILEDFGGESLARLKIAGKLSLESFLNLAIALSEILATVHGANIIHKDINPSNIVFNASTGVLKLIDFGISAILSQENLPFKNPNLLEGTLAYLAPEQTGRMNRVIDYRADFYSLGVTCYELLTGQLPFDHDDLLELIHYHIAKQPISPTQIQPDIPPMLSEIVLKLMAKNAEDRYQSALGLKADLEQCLYSLKATGKIPDFRLGKQDIYSRFQIPQKLYGRTSEIQILLAAFERISQKTRKNPASFPSSSSPDSHSRIFPDSLSSTPFNSARELILVCGYSGVGKTALVREIYRPITAKKGNFIAGKFDQYQRSIPYSAISQAFNHLCSQLLSERENILTQWKHKILAAVGNNGQVLIDIIPQLEFVIGQQPAVPPVAAKESENRFNFVFQNFIKALSQPEHPLVLFLDDLQWADSGSLNLLKTIMSDKTIHHFLILGAYRDNEVAPNHPLMLTLNEIQKESGIVSFIHLENITNSDVNQLIAETLSCGKSKTQSLTNLVYQKTNGNPFFTLEFLRSLYSKKLISYDPSHHHWDWNVGEIEAQNMSNNVADLMAATLQKLPPATQMILSLAACIGNSFDLSTLAIISQQAAISILNDLLPACKAGVVFPINEQYKLLQFTAETQGNLGQFKFVHDRVQQVAYALIDDLQKPAVHLKIGRLLLQKTPPEFLSQEVFSMIDHLNLGVELIRDQSERNHIAQLNLMAGEKAKIATAYEAAAAYLQRGREVLAPNCWQMNYDLTLALYVEGVEAEYLNTHYEQAEFLADIVLQNAKNFLDKVRVYQIKIQFYSGQNQLQKAMDTTLDVLQLLGISLSASPPKNLILQDLSQLAFMSDRHQLAALRILMIVWGTAVIVAPELLMPMASTMVDLTLKYGKSPLAAFSYAYYGFNLCTALSDIELGYQLGTQALQLLEQFETRETKCKVNHIFNAFIRHWKEPVANAIQGFSPTIQIGLETGDLEYTCYAAMQLSCYSLLAGEPLEIVEEKHRNSIQLIQNFKQEFQLYYAKIWAQLTLNLRGQAVDKLTLTGELFDETENLPLLIANKNDTSLFCFYVAKLILYYLFNQPEKAVLYGALAAEYEPAIASLFPRGQNPFYYALALLAHYPNLPETQQVQCLELIEIHQNKLKIWADYAPMNYQHKYELVAAERARIQGDYWQATKLYHQSVQNAQHSDYLHEEALAYELAGEFYLAQGMTEIAHLHLTNAYDTYGRWGSTAKIQDLEERYPDLLQPKNLLPSETGITTSHDITVSTHLDLTSILKATQAISSEIEIGALLKKLLKILLENAGAEVGYLILEKQGDWVIEASGNVETDSMKILQSIPIKTVSGRSKTPWVSNAIIHYVIRTQKSVVLGNAAQEGAFTHNVYVRRQKPKSVLCFPLMNQGKLLGILYLENNLTTDAFTDDRLEVLHLLLTQAAISLENAKLYAQLCQSENKLTQFLEALPVGVSVIEPQGNVVYINQKGQEILGQGVEATTTETLPSIYQIYRAGTDEIVPATDLPVARSLQGESIQTDQIELHQNGKIIPLQVYSTPVFDEQGQVIYAINAFTDITERKQTEKILADYNRILAAQVAERTDELARINAHLEQEIAERKEAEKALKDSEERWQLALRGTNDAIWDWNLQTNQVFFSPRWKEMRGFADNEISNSLEEWAARIHPEDYEKVMALLADHFAQKTPFFSVEYRVKRKDHSYIWILDRGQAIWDQAGKVIRMAGSETDISDRKQTEAALKESENRFRGIFEQVAVGIGLCTLDGEFFRVNQKLCDILGYTPAEMRSRHFLDLTVVKYRPQLRMVTQQIVSGELKTGSLEYRCICKDGSLVWVNVAVSAIQESTGEPQYLIYVVQDISDRFFAQEALQTSEKALAEAQKIAHLGNWSLDISTQTLLWSEETFHIHGLDPHQGEPTYQQLLQQIHPDDLELFKGNAEQAMTEGKPFDHEIRLFRPDGDLRYTFHRGQAILNEAGQVIKLFGIVQDISDRKQIEEALRSSEQRFQEIANTISQLFFVRLISTGQFLYISPGYEKIWGRSRESLYQNPTTWMDSIHPEDRKLLEKSVLDQFQGNPVKREYRIVRPDHSIRWISADISLVRDDTGKPVRFVGMAEDITERKEAELALHVVNERLQYLLTANPAVIFTCKPEGDYTATFMSQNVQTVLGYEAADFLKTAKFWSSRVHPDDINHIVSNVSQLFDQGFTSYEYRFLHRDGTYHWIYSQLKLIRDPSGHPIEMVGYLTDISDRKQAEAALQQSEARYLGILQDQTELIARFLPDGTFTFINDAYCRYFGIQREDFIGKCYEPVIFAEDIEKVNQLIQSITWENPVVMIENRVVVGSEIRWTQWVNRAVFDADHQLVEVQCVGRDISDRKQAEQALQKSEERYRQIVETAEEGIWGIDFAGNTTFVNPKMAQMLGYSPEEMLGKPLFAFMDEEGKVITAQNLERRRQGIQEKHDFKFLRKDGSEVWVIISTSPIFDDAGQPTGALGMITDISDRKQAEIELQKAKEAAEAANRAKSAFLANMSHELRTPLNAILGFAQLMVNSPHLLPEDRERIRIISRSGEYLLNLINDVLDMAKIEAQRSTLNLQNFDLHSLLSDIEEMFRFKAQTKGLQLMFQSTKDVPQFIRADEMKLRQILINLLNNAIKFTTIGSVSVSIRAEVEASSPQACRLIFEIADTGCGIAPNEIENIFEAFVQTKSGRQAQEGTGLGLPISRSFVRLMGGEITVTSVEEEGSNVCFDIHVNLVEATEIEAKLPIRRAIALQPNQPPYRILIVDDRWDNRQLLVQLLAPIGFEIQEARDGKQAVTIWQEWQPHLIWMDLRMPVMDGYEATKQIRAQPKGHIPTIIGLSASTLESVRMAALNAGCNDFVGKPCQDADILAFIHKYIGAQYVYEEPPTVPALAPAPSITLTPEMLTGLPPEWLANFHQATTEGDFDSMLALIEEIHPDHELIANALTELTNNFEFLQLLSLIQPQNISSPLKN